MEKLQQIDQAKRSPGSASMATLIWASQDPDPAVRMAAADALGARSPAPDVFGVLVSALSKERVPKNLASIACALARSYSDKAFDPLFDALVARVVRESDLVFQRRPARRSGRIGYGSRRAQCSFSGGASLHIFELLKGLPGGIDAAALSQSLSHENAQVRWAAASLLIGSGNRETVEVPAVIESIADRGVRQSDIALIAATYEEQIAQGSNTSVDLLVRSIKTFGTPSMAAAFIGSGHPELIEAGNSWATRFGFDNYIQQTDDAHGWGVGSNEQ